jgi:hypothetical protein
MVPNYDLFPLHIPQIKIMLGVGAYVVIKSLEVEEKFQIRSGKIIGQIISYDENEETICCNIMIPLYKIIDTININREPTEQVRFVQNGVAAGVLEVANTTGISHNVVVSKKDIDDIAFVFHFDDFKNGTVYGQGIPNCYLLRYEYSDDNQLVPTQYVSCFPSYYSKKFFHRCIISILWKRISSLQDTVWKILNSRSERQNTTVKVPFPFDNDIWSYLLFRTEGFVEPKEFTKDGRIRSLTLKGIKRETFRPEQKSLLLRFETERQLTCLRSILGDATTLGIRRRNPKLKCQDSFRPLSKLNVVLGSEQKMIPINKRANTSRIDFFIMITSLI